MAVKLIFESTDLSSSGELQCYLNSQNEIFVEIEMDGLPPCWVTLNKQDAIKLVKVLKTEINGMEVNNV